ncbi:hypothetical protein Pdw03_7063 [Penicillium digitatum]|uniref:Uncharacterized protein n=1 Tax=Penicillium digitatum TaxID=36651 RepID=A0A7T7BKI1_PENDI|nr:hypothetical protein Pdw03_7063 [Penicillium digitatum]
MELMGPIWRNAGSSVVTGHSIEAADATRLITLEPDCAKRKGNRWTLFSSCVRIWRLAALHDILPKTPKRQQETAFGFFYFFKKRTEERTTLRIDQATMRAAAHFLPWSRLDFQFGSMENGATARMFSVFEEALEGQGQYVDSITPTGPTVIRPFPFMITCVQAPTDSFARGIRVFVRRREINRRLRKTVEGPAIAHFAYELVFL